MENTCITGLGLISTAGFNQIDFWQNLHSGKNTYYELEELKDRKDYRYKVGAKIKEEDYLLNTNAAYRIKYGRSTVYALESVLSALEDAQLDVESLPKGRTAICIGTTMGEIQVEEQISKQIVDNKNIDKDVYYQYKTDNILFSLFSELNITGPAYLIPAACASGNYAIAVGKRLIESGKADVAIVGGVDVFSRVAFVGFQRLLSLSTKLCKPFDKTREGLIVGEGCGIIILERENHAKARKAKIKANVLGEGIKNDTYSMTAPHPKGEGGIKAMQLALNKASLKPGDIDYISAHGTGTRLNDTVEINSIIEVFGDNKPCVSSIKSMLGHPMGAASALEMIASVLMFENQTLLPTMNFTEADKSYDIDFIPNVPKEKKLKYILSNSFGFGGQTSCVIIENY